METKTSKLICCFSHGMIKEAFAILKTFRREISKEDKRTVEIAYECMTGKESFYNQIGIDTISIKKQAFEVLASYVKFH